MKKNSIVRKLIVTFTSITGGVLVIVAIIISLWINKSYNLEKIQTLEKQLDVVEQSLSNYLNQEDSDYSQLQKILYMSTISTGMDAIVVDKLGYVYIVSDDKYSNLKYTKLEVPKDIQSKIEDMKNKNKPVTMYKRGALKVYINPINANGGFDGYIIMVSNDNYEGKGMLITIWISVAIAMVISGVIVHYFAKRLVIKPLEEINNAAKKIAKGEVEKRVQVLSNDEIGQLAESFNSMAEALEADDTKRKDFISNVSHELRSPITSIRGFVGGILDGVIPKDKENYYLKIVYDEINRLTRLVNDLLDISAMESGKFNLQTIEFDINGVISLCILNLEGKIQSKGLNVRVIFDEKRKFVIADRDRIIQVITNILENAIKYGDDNGEIIVNVYSKGPKSYVSIFNSGQTIPKEDINNIWNRFYKSDKARTNKISVGLGLPIVRLILSQHNQDIWVENIEEKGVKFTFSLKKSD